MIAARQIFLGRGGAKLPYDAEVEYLESVGTQWISTGFYSNNTDSFALTFILETSYSGYMGSNGNLQGNMDFVKGLGKCKLEVKRSENDGPYTYVNGSLVQKQNFNNYNGLIIALFALGDSATTVGFHARAKLYAFSMRINGALVLNMIPVRFTNELGQSEGAMYDRANPTVGMNRDGTPRDDGLYLNRGTNAFGYGDDK